MRLLPLTLSLLAAAAATLPGAEPELAPFVLPWDEAPTGPTSLASWNPGPAGAAGWVGVDAAGHFSVGGQRIRFLGVNFTSGSNFPVPEHADRVAARLASFGVNSARFHHMDAPWAEPALLDYAGGGTRRLNPESFARLHHFVQALKARGIYSDINLLVSRNFTAEDGFPAEIERLGWKDQGILGFFVPQALELQQEYARLLLTTPGPNGAPPLGQEPAVAFVELLNENGVIQKWYEGVLDELPAVFRTPLEQRWLAWLRQHYKTTEELRRAWGGRAEPAAAFVVAPGLAGSGGGWQADLAPGATAKASSFQMGDGHAVIRVEVKAVDVNRWEQARLRARNFQLEAGKLYTVSFNGTAERPVTLYLHLNTGPEEQVTRLASVKLAGAWSRHEATFVAPVSGPASLTLGGMNYPVKYDLSDLAVREGGELRGLGHGSLELGLVPPLPGLARTGPTFTAEAQRDWMAFLYELEETYWNTMYRFVKQTLGYRGVVFGTIISNSPAGIQGRLDAVDGHCYWTHPRFPGGDWDEENWVVEPKTMAGAPAGSTITLLAKQRVQGKPFTVTEYQHCAPNPFTAESPLFAGAYGALQDWDGVWFFEYSVPLSPSAAEAYAGRIGGFFDDSQHPARLVNYLLAAALFRRGDASAARGVQAVPLGKDRELALLRTRGAPWAMPDAATAGLDPLWALRQRVALDLKSDTASPALPALPGSPLVHAADTGELTWDAATPDRAAVRIVTPRTRAAAGFIAGQPCPLGDVVFDLRETSQNWATAGLMLLEGEFAGEKPGRGLIIATARVENTNQHWKTPERSALGKAWGDAPTRIETVRGEVRLPLPAARVTAYALDEHGQRRAPATVRERDGQAAIALGEPQSGATLWYEFIIAGK